MDLRTVVDISQVAASITVIGGVVFALLQLREFRRQRQEAVVLDLMRTFMDAEFAEAMAIVTNLPDGMTGQELRARGPSVEKAATLMCTTFEAMGLMVHRRVAPLELVEDLAGGIISVMWRRLEPWITMLRVEQANPTDSEWFQWLAERIDQGGRKQVPAYQRHRDWTPR